MVVSDAFHALAAHPSDGIEAGIDLGLRTGFGDDWLRLGPMKVFTDGSLVGRTAAMSAPFDGDPGRDPGNSGYLQADAGQLDRDDHRRAPGRLAGRRARDRRPGHRPRPRRVRRGAGRVSAAATRGTGSSTSPPPARTRWPGRRAGRDRRRRRAGSPPRSATGCSPPSARTAHAWLYRQRSLLDAGLVLPGSSDRPVVTGAPLLGIHDMVNRRTASGAPFNAGEAITAEEALRAYTWGSAYASKAEHVKGSIEPGKLADFTVLSEDPTAVSPGPHRRPRGDRDHRRRPVPLRPGCHRRPELGPASAAGKRPAMTSLPRHRAGGGIWRGPVADSPIARVLRVVRQSGGTAVRYCRSGLRISLCYCFAAGWSPTGSDGDPAG